LPLPSLQRYYCTEQQLVQTEPHRVKDNKNTTQHNKQFHRSRSNYCEEIIEYIIT
jgi:hypothetical protein